MRRSMLAILGVLILATAAVAAESSLPPANGAAVIELADGSEIRIAGYDKIEFTAGFITANQVTRRTELREHVRIKVVRNGTAEALTIKTSKAVIVPAPVDTGH